MILLKYAYKIFRRLIIGYQSIKTFILSYKKKSALIIIYHRVQDVSADPNLLCVSKENFDQQIYFLKNNFQIIKLSELVERVKNKKIEGNEVVITFDDGYKDNIENAAPILEKYQAPATIYIASKNITEDKTHPWDLNYPDEDRGKYMNKEDLKNLSMNNLFEIGAHTLNHKKLSRLNKKNQEIEILGSKNELEKILSIGVDTFSYPFGSHLDFNADSIRIVKKSGFKYACAAWQQVVTNNTSVFKLPRFIAKDCNGHQFKKDLNKIKKYG